MKKTKPTVNWKKYFISTNPNVEYYSTPNGFKFLEQCFIKLRRGIQFNTPQITLIKFHNSKIVSVINREDYLVAIQIILKLCIKLEYYEICAEISNFLKKGKSKSFQKQLTL